ncbi:MAG: hypothetical protein HYY93_00305 [Planctomycetes bacterium]|nr:hypothetical protein [Planctomycetota bacterium]
MKKWRGKTSRRNGAQVCATLHPRAYMAGANTSRRIMVANAASNPNGSSVSTSDTTETTARRPNENEAMSGQA